MAVHLDACGGSAQQRWRIHEHLQALFYAKLHVGSPARSCHRSRPAALTPAAHVAWMHCGDSVLRLWWPLKTRMAVDRRSTEDPWAFARVDLSPFGVDRLNDDYENRGVFVLDRPRGAASIPRPDFAAGWIAAMVRISQWSYFTPEGRARLGS